MNLGAILGQPRAVECLSRAAASGRVGHAYLFAGPVGVGKKAAAIAFARALNCESPGMDGDSCGECGPCREIEHGTFADVMSIAPEGEDARESSFHAEQVSAAIARASLSASPRHRKCFILEDVHLMSPESANRLLKILEEPPARTVWMLLTAEPERVLPTVRSRCQTVRFGLLPRGAAAEILRRNGTEPDERILGLLMGQVDRPPEAIVEMAGIATEFLGKAAKFDLAGLVAQSKETAKDSAALTALLDGLERVCGERLRADPGMADKWLAALDAVGQARQRFRRYAEKTLVDSLGAELSLIFNGGSRA